MFTYDTSLFSVVHDITTFSCDLNYDWSFQWKMRFNPEPSKKSSTSHIYAKILEKKITPIIF